MTARVLIAEDEENIAESLSFILRRDGFEVDGVSDGASALNRVRGGRFDLLMLDVMLPAMNGFEVLKNLRADAALRDLPVVVVSAKAQAQDRELAASFGVQAYVTKPFSNREVVDLVRRLTAR
ncbi:response regulator transcription factor [Piscinibacter koreensis]|uniref:Response regulator n=1 Tax=Piscinibacter koreensis TaxID=2742824 RepID=A0A7Y6NPY3_9BURK|nr:response regulator [Schlegelella koreensis]NUZ07087.1 response regulator [Schlegelella koreensis]